MDVYRNGWIGDYVDAINFLELWTCDSGNNNSNYCDEDYDALLEEARHTPDDAARYAAIHRSLLAGLLWQRIGPAAPFWVGATTALVAAGLLLVWEDQAS